EASQLLTRGFSTSFFVVGFLLVFFQCYGPHRDLHSFPTRRSSDLVSARRRSGRQHVARSRAARGSHPACRRPTGRDISRDVRYRSEEHTSELQSRSDLVCRLLLEKKKKK